MSELEGFFQRYWTFNVCLFHYTQLVIEAAIRVKDFVPTGETISLKVSTVDHSDTPSEITIDFTVADFDATLVELTEVKSEDLKVNATK